MRDDEQKIRDLFTAWHSATTNGDVSKLLSLMAEDVVFLVPGHPPMRGRETFAAAFRAGLQHYRIDYTWEVEEIHITEGLAYSWCHLSVMVTPLQGGSPMRRTGYTLTILRKQPDGSWVIARDANMLASDQHP